MYSAFRETCGRILRIPHDPTPPPGDEASTRTFRAASNFYKYLLAIWAIRAVGSFVVPCMGLGVALFTLAVVHKQGSHFAFFIVLAIAIVVVTLLVLVNLFSLAVIKLEYEKRWYLVTDRSLRIREGVIFVREMTVNFANIQNISISQGPIQRALGIADLRVDTAGGGGGAVGNQAGQNLHTAWFRGIDNASDVRLLIQNRLQHMKDAGLGDPEEKHSIVFAGPSDTTLIGPLREVLAETTALRKMLTSQKS